MDGMTPQQEERLAAEARGGDRDALGELIRATWPAVYAQAFLHVGDRHRAEDVCQEAFLAATRRIASLEEPRGFRAWVLAIAANAAAESARRSAALRRGGGSAERRLDPADLSALADARGTAPDRDAEAAERRETVLGILRSLPEEYRLPLTLRHIAGADHADIRGRLGLSDGALRGLLHRGMKLLRQRLAAAGVIDSPP
jgi:RNA polymerase sigma-70 factor (ECF subfamily)